MNSKNKYSHRPSHTLKDRRGFYGSPIYSPGSIGKRGGKTPGIKVHAHIG